MWFDLPSFIITKSTKLYGHPFTPHQGDAFECDPLTDINLTEAAASLKTGGRRLSHTFTVAGLDNVPFG